MPRRVSACPCANLFTELNNSGHASTTSAACVRVPIGVENTTTRQPASWSKVTSDERGQPVERRIAVEDHGHT